MPARFFTLVILLAAACESAHGKTYTSPTYGYYLEVPDDWVQVPDKIYKEWMKIISEGDEPTIYETAFQAADTGSIIGYPRIELGFVSNDRNGFIQQATESEMRGLAGAIAKSDSLELRVITGNDATQDSVLPSLNKVTLDLPNHRIVWSQELDVEGEPVIWHAVMAFGRRGWVNAIYWVKKDRVANTATVWEHAVNSLQFGPADRYSVATASPRDKATPVL